MFQANFLELCQRNAQQDGPSWKNRVLFAISFPNHVTALTISHILSECLHVCLSAIVGLSKDLNNKLLLTITSEQTYLIRAQHYG